MAKKNQPNIKRAPTAGEVAKWQKQEKRNRVVFILGVVVIVAVLGLLGYGYYDGVYKDNHEESTKLHKTVVQVGDEKFNLQYVIDVLRFYNTLQAQQAQSNPNDISSLNTYTLNDIVQLVEYNALLKNAAPELGISIEGNELDASVKAWVFPQGAPEGLTDDQIARYYNAQLKAYHITDRELRNLITANLLDPKLREYLKSQVPATSEQVHVEGVLVDGTKVTAVSDRLVFTSDTLNDVASAFSKLTSGQTTADLGWMTKGIMGNNFDDTVFSLEPGVLSQPILDETNQYPNAEWLISVLEKSPDRAIDDNQKNNLAAANYSEWFQQRLQQGLASKQVIDNLSDSLKTWATKYMKDHPLK